MTDLDRWLAIQEQIAHLIVSRRAVTNDAAYRAICAKLDALHERTRPLWTALLATHTVAQLDAAWNARCAAIIGEEIRR